MIIAIRYLMTEVPDGALAAFKVTANGQLIGEVRQIAHGLWPGAWVAIPADDGQAQGGYRKRSDAGDALLERTGVLG